MLLGAHQSIAGGIYQSCFRAQEDGCEALQIFSKSANQWGSKPLTEEDTGSFIAARDEVGIARDAVTVHDSYLINLGNPDEKKWSRAVHYFRIEMERTEALDIPFLVFHPGAHVGSGEKRGIAQVAKALNMAISETEGFGMRCLIETTAGQGTYLGHTFEQIAEIIDGIDDKKRVGACYDTCHTFAAGYDIRTKEAYDQTFQEFDDVIGLDRLFAFHLNDSLKGLGSKVDRHEQIGDGEIGLDGFRFLVNDKRFDEVPGILETPPMESGEDSYQRNLKALRDIIEK